MNTTDCRPRFSSARQVGDVLRLVVPVDALGRRSPPRASTISGCLRIASSATDSSFLLTIASTMPRRVSALTARWKSTNASPFAVVAAEAQVLPADVADDAAPQRVVEIEHEQLARPAGEPAQRGLRIRRAASAKTSVVKRDLAEVPRPWREPAPGRVDPALRVEDMQDRRTR